MKGAPFQRTILAKGQITIPAAVVKRLGWHPGQRLNVRVIANDEFTVNRRAGDFGRENVV